MVVTRCRSAAADVRRKRLNVAERRKADIADRDHGCRIWAESRRSNRDRLRKNRSPRYGRHPLATVERSSPCY
jgi:hypothetical protein